MRIRMVIAQRLQEAGAERPLSIGEVYDVSDVVGSSLIASGDAVLAGPVVLETKPAAALETKPAIVADVKRRPRADRELVAHD